MGAEKGESHIRASIFQPVTDICTEYNLRSQLRRSENNVGTFIPHFMSKRSSELLKVNLKIQQSPKEK